MPVVSSQISLLRKLYQYTTMGMVSLSLLWRYTLLQCSLASRADNYPGEAFQLLLLLRQEAKAIGLAELLTDTSRKVEVFIQIAKHLAEQPDRKVESHQLFTRANEVAKMIQDADTRGKALFRLIEALCKANKHERSLALVQHSWLQTITRIEALDLLQIANPFIALKLELGTAFFEAFAWVDNFLKG